MAIGDKPNSNLFGTNFNDDDKDKDKEKEAQLAAQNVRIGAGNIPASAFGQAPAVNPFSMEAAGQVNPMLRPQNLESFVQPQVTFKDYDVPETPRASALSVFTPSGDVKPNIDVNAITLSPEITSDSAVNTALNQEVAVGPTSNEPGFLYNTFVNAPVKADQIATEFMSNLGNKISTGYNNLLGSAMRNLTPAEDRKFTNNEPFGKTFTDTFAITRPDGTKFYPDEVMSSAGATQTTPGASALGATQGVTLPVERPMAGAQEQPGAVVSPFLQSPDTPSGLGGPLLRGFEMVNEAARGPNAPMGQDATRAALGGMTLNEYLSAPAGTEGVSGLRTDPQGRMIPSSNTVGGPTTRAEAFPGYESEVAKAQARLSERDIRPGETQAQRDTRIQRDQSIVSGQTGGQLSQADLRDLAQASMGDATEGKVARGLQIQQRAGLGQFEQDSTGGLTFEQKLAQDKFELEQNQDILAAETKAKEAEGERSVNRAKALGSLQALKADLDLIKETGEEVRTLTLKPRTEGLLAKALATVSPTSSAAQLERASGVLTGDAFIKGMQVIKAFGGGLGSVTEVEGLKVERAQGAIFENGMGDEERRQAVKDYIQVRENAYNRIREAFVKEYGETDAQTYLGTQNTNATAGKAIPNDRNVSVEVSPELEQYFN